MDERVATGMSEARPASASWDENAHAQDESREATIVRGRAVCRSAEADTGRRETSSPLVMPYGAKDSVGRPRRASGESEPGTHEVWVHAVRLGGRHRLDASRVFHSGRSQGLTVTEGR